MSSGLELPRAELGSMWKTLDASSRREPPLKLGANSLACERFEMGSSKVTERQQRLFEGYLYLSTWR